MEVCQNESIPSGTRWIKWDPGGAACIPMKHSTAQGQSRHVWGSCGHSASFKWGSLEISGLHRPALQMRVEVV